MDDRIAQMITRVEAFMVGRDDALALPREAAVMVHALVLASRARIAVEIGTSYGYSGLWIAAALAEGVGHLVTMDHDPRKTQVARDFFDQAGLAHRVTLRTGEALDLLPELEGPIDFVLNDADKEHCIEYVELLLPKLADGAVLMTDNTKTHPTQLASFVHWMSQHPGFVSVDIPIGNGMLLAVRRPEVRIA